MFVAEKEKNEKRSKADAYWLAKYEDDKEKQLHSTKVTQVETSSSNSNDVNFDTWDHYKHDFIENIPPQKSPIEQELEGKQIYVLLRLRINSLH